MQKCTYHSQWRWGVITWEEDENGVLPHASCFQCFSQVLDTFIHTCRHCWKKNIVYSIARYKHSITDSHPFQHSKKCVFLHSRLCCRSIRYFSCIGIWLTSGKVGLRALLSSNTFISIRWYYVISSSFTHHHPCSGHHCHYYDAITFWSQCIINPGLSSTAATVTIIIITTTTT